MSIALTIVLVPAVLVVLANTGLYVWRARRLRSLPLCDAVDPLGVFPAMLAFARECLALAAVGLSIPCGWRLSLRWSASGVHGPIILIHGWGANAGSLWYLRRRLRRDGWGPIACFTYTAPRNTTGGAAIELAANRLRQLIQQIQPASPQPLTLIGVGLGGLIARYCVRRYPLPTVRRIVTLGTAHAGTELAQVGPLRDTLAPGAPLLNKLNAVDHVPQQFDVIAIHSTFDATVLPPGNARYPEAFNIQVSDVGHCALLFSGKVYGLIAENLRAPLR